ncbi:MAG: amidase family protein [Quisquiliibacterium sp.]
MSEQIVARWLEVENYHNHIGKMAWASLSAGLAIQSDEVAAARVLAAEFTDQIDNLLAGYDALILPTTMDVAPLFSDFKDGEAVWTAMRTIPFNLSGHPALTVPIGFDRGMPLGMQIIGARGADARVLEIGAAFEAATDHLVLRPY